MLKKVEQMRMQIIVTTQFIAMHCWPDAPYFLEFLRHPHRHTFHVKVGIGVDHACRHREFFIEKGKVDHLLSEFIKLRKEHHAENFSCEEVALYLLHNIEYATWAEVWEDNENGARVERQ